MLGSDSNNDSAGDAADQVDFPVHVLAINALGVHLLDYLEFGELVPAVRAGGPLVIPVRHRPAAAGCRDRLPGQPDRDPVTLGGEPGRGSGRRQPAIRGAGGSSPRASTGPSGSR